MSQDSEATSKAIIFDAIKHAAPTVSSDPDVIQKKATALLQESQFARPALLATDTCEAFIKRIESGLVIGTTCEKIHSLQALPDSVKHFLDQHALPYELKVQETTRLTGLNWQDLGIDADIEKDHSVGLCWAEYGIAETGSFIIHSSEKMPILLNFLPLYQLIVLAKSSILPFLDDYGQVANTIAADGKTPRNMCLITGASGTTDIEGVLVQGAHGPEFLHIVIIDDL